MRTKQEPDRGDGPALTLAISRRGLTQFKEGAPNATKFVLFRTAGTNEPEPILINPAHIRTVRQSGSAQVTLVMDDGEGGGYQNVEGDLKSVWEKLTGESEQPQALEENLTWTRREPKVD